MAVLASIDWRLPNEHITSNFLPLPLFDKQLEYSLPV
jgi:hypothetical protein